MRYADRYVLFSPDLGGLYQLSERSVCPFLFCYYSISRKTVFKCCQEFTCGLCVPLSEAVGSYAENQRITAVRRVYQRGCVNPMINIEQLWRDYSKYEEVRDAARVSSCLSGQAAFLPSHLTSVLL